MTISNTETPDRILKWHTVAQSVPFSRSYAYALSAKGKFPKPIKLIKNGRASGWLKSEIDAWVNDRIQDTRGSGHNEEV